MADTVIERDDLRPADDSLAELRSLIVGPEQRELLTLQSHLFDPSVHTRDVSSVLPDAIALRATDPQLTRALAPSIEEAVTASVRRDPRPLADALFPVMGPAIRKAIAHTLATMMESLSRTIEYSVSWRALRWRWTAFRTGKPFAEIVLLNTLHYRVEQLFLIHAETGLLLQHVSSDRASAQDADQISAMLTAIRDFTRDSFRTADGDSVDALRVGELSVLVEQGPHALLAAVVRGTAPMTLQVTFQDALESIERQFGQELKAFRGDSAPFERARPILEPCLVTQFRDRAERKASRWWAIAAVAILLAIGVWSFLYLRDGRRWNTYIESLRAEPGILVYGTERRGGRFFVSGLRDPLAQDPARLVSLSRLSPSSVEARWEPFESLAPKFVVARARNLLRPPPGVTLAFRDGVLTASGPAPALWIVESERLAPALPGVRRFDYQGTSPEMQLKERLEAMSILFIRNESRLVPGQADAVRSAEKLLAELNQVLRVRGERARVEVIGHTDTDGTDRENGPLSQARAEQILGSVRSPLFDAIEFSARGVGSSAPLTPGATEVDKQRNRRASFRVSLPPASGQDTQRP
jgi:outer membrane protein OmpA-like peptidoglycan-associated protein